MSALTPDIKLSKACSEIEQALLDLRVNYFESELVDFEFRSWEPRQAVPDAKIVEHLRRLTEEAAGFGHSSRGTQFRECVPLILEPVRLFDPPYIKPADSSYAEPTSRLADFGLSLTFINKLNVMCRPCASLLDYEWESCRGACEPGPAECAGEERPSDCLCTKDGLPCLACRSVSYRWRGQGLTPRGECFYLEIVSRAVIDPFAAQFQFWSPQASLNNHPQSSISPATHTKSTASQAPHAPPAKSAGLNAHRKPTALPQRK